MNMINDILNTVCNISVIFASVLIPAIGLDCWARRCSKRRAKAARNLKAGPTALC